ncbi:MAG: OmpA family protein [Phycisphaeraceae bacterium]|nr:OmpA family protein [Phycisphaeraceae bacterium]
MRIPWRSRYAIVLLAAGLMYLTGCCSDARLKEERDALYTQNQDLQDQLTKCRTALDACENAKQGMESQIQLLQSQLDAARAQGSAMAVPAAPLASGSAANTGFSAIPGVETIQGKDRITVRVPGDILFASGKITLKNEALKTLDQIAIVIRRDYPTNRIRIEGYTDTDPIRKSKWIDNLDLSLERSAAVHRHLQKKGVDAKRMEAVGLGEWHPRGSKQQSRRVEIVVVTSGS